MALEPNGMLGHYRIGGVIGAGGMGQVFAATDTALERVVAIKVLPESFANDADRIARFEREAKTLASLNHNNIAQIYGIERGAVTAIVMELVEGPTLADRIAEGPLPPDEALGIARQILDGLEAAHEKGIVHRDLKPANIKLRPDGVVKILDFGIAKPIAAASSSGGGHSPTRMTPAMTEAGVIMGTAAYMSPEQARGKFVDQRTDIWAFGCLLFEMLTGQPAFMGDDVMVVLASILRDKSDLTSIPAAISPSVRHAIKLCLEKDARKRLHHMGDVRLALSGALESELAAQETTRRSSPLQFWSRALPLALIVAALGSVAAWQLKPEAPRPINRFSYSLPSDLRFRRLGENIVAFAPDGRHIAMNTNAGLYLRSLGTLEGRIIAGTEEDLDTPFFSPDGQWLAYWTPDNVIKRVGLSGGAPVVVARGVGNPFGASWNANGTMLVADEQGIKRFPATGGTPELLFPVAEGGELFLAPQLLPDGDTVLYGIGRQSDWDSGRIVARSITTGELTPLIEGGSAPHYFATGHIVYALGNDLLAQAFDATALTVSGGVVPMVQGVQRALSLRTGLANFGISDDGTLVYLRGTTGSGPTLRSPIFVDRGGRPIPTGMRPCACWDPAPSPDGTRIAFTQIVASGASDVWVWSIAQATFTRLTFETGEFVSPVWSPDGESIAYGSRNGLFVRRADGTGEVRTLLEGNVLAPWSWSAEGELIYTVVKTDGNRDIGVLSVTGDPAPRPLLASTANETRPDLSPDGRWLAYMSNESGRAEIYVRPYPEVDTGRWLVSQNGGAAPQWSADSRTLYFISPEAMMAAAVTPAPAFVFAAPEPLFNHTPNFAFGLDSAARGYAVAPNREALIMFGVTSLDGGEVVIVQNWAEELTTLVPTQ